MSRGTWWDLDELAYMARHVGEQTDTEIGEAIGRTPMAVAQMGRHCGLVRPRYVRSEHAVVDPQRHGRVDRYAAAVAAGWPIPWERDGEIAPRRHEAHEAGMGKPS